MPVYEYQILVKYGDGKKRKEKRYKFDYKKVIDGVPVHRKKEGFLSRDEALEEERIDKLNLGQPKAKKETITMDNLFVLFINYKSTKQKPTTVENYRHLYNKYISDIGKQPLSIFKPIDISKWKSNIIDAELSEDHSNKIIGLMNNLLLFARKKGYAFDERILDELDSVKLNTIPTERIAWTIDEIERFFSTFDYTDARDDLFGHYFLILLDSTCRPNEFRVLQKKDIIGQYLNITKTCTSKVKGKGLIIQPPKTASSVRKVIMPNEDIEWMLEHTKDYADDDYIFGKENVLSETTLRRELDKHIELSGVRHIGLYNLRHTSITNLLLNNNVPLLIVSKRAGHSSVSTTMNHYWHLFNGDDAKALEGITWNKRKSENH